VDAEVDAPGTAVGGSPGTGPQSSSPPPLGVRTERAAPRRRLAAAAPVAGPLVCTTAWVVWAYLRTRVPASVSGSHPPLAKYGAWAYSHVAYSDLLTLYHLHHLADHAFPYVHTTIEYPVLTGLFMWSAAWAPGVGGYFLASALGLLVCAWGTVVLLHRWSRRAAWIFALSPLLLVYGILNWDMLAVVCMLGGWDCYQRRRYGWAGVLLMAGVCAKFFPVFLLVLCVLGCFARGAGAGARRGGMVMTGTAALTALVLNIPFAVLNFASWNDFLSFNATRGGGGGLLYQLHLAQSWSIGTFDAVSVLLMAGVLVALALWVLRGAPVAPAAAAAVATLMLLNKVFSPQYMLWVFVFGVLAAWPGWTLAAVTMAGLVDFANAMITLHLVATHSPAFPWYFATVFPLDRALRTVAVACGLGASLWRGSDDPGATWRRWRRALAGRARPQAVSGVAG